MAERCAEGMREQVSDVAPPVVRPAGRPGWRRPLMVIVGLLALRAIQAAVAAATVLIVRGAHLVQPAPGLRVTRLAEVSPDPLTSVTAFVLAALAATLAAVLLPRRHLLAAFAGIKAFALLAATTVTFALTGGPAAPRLALAACGVSLTALFWPSARDAVLRVLAALGLPHPPGRLGDLAVAAKIAVLVLIVAVPG